jgi:hypothetical protein
LPPSRPPKGGIQSEREERGSKGEKREKIRGKAVKGGRWRDGTSDKSGVGTTQ